MVRYSFDQECPEFEELSFTPLAEYESLDRVPFQMAHDEDQFRQLLSRAQEGAANADELELLAMIACSKATDMRDLATRENRIKTLADRVAAELAADLAAQADQFSSDARLRRETAELRRIRNALCHDQTLSPRQIAIMLE